MFSRTARTHLSSSLIFFYRALCHPRLCIHTSSFFPFTCFHFFSFTSTSISICPLLLSSLPRFSPLMAMTSVLFIFRPVHSLCPAMDGAVAALTHVPNSTQGAHSHTNAYKHVRTQRVEQQTVINRESVM